MTRRLLAVILLALMASAGTSWAISSEPVYIKSPEQLQALAGHLETLQKRLKAHLGLFDGQDKLASMLEAELNRLGSAAKADKAMKIDVTKLYRSLDADGTALTLKNRSGGAPVLEEIARCIDLISSSNGHTPRWKW